MLTLLKFFVFSLATAFSALFGLATLFASGYVSALQAVQVDSNELTQQAVFSYHHEAWVTHPPFWAVTLAVVIMLMGISLSFRLIFRKK